MSDAVLAKYPRSAEIKRVIAAVANAGLQVGSVEISPTGAFRIYAVGAKQTEIANDFDEWEKRGAL